MASGAQEPATQDPVPAAASADSAASATARPLTHGLFTLPEEEDTVVRAVPAQILALSRAPEDTKTIPVPRELLELSRRDAARRPNPHIRHDEAELPVWDAWYGSADYQEDPVFDLSPSQRVSRNTPASPWQPRSLEALSADDLLLLQALAPSRRFAAPVMLLMLAALGAAASYWSMP